MLIFWKQTVFIFLLLPVFCQGQKSSGFLPDQPGKCILSKNLINDGNTFHQNVKSVTEWLLQEVPLLANPRGFDLWVYLTGNWDDKYRLRQCNYGERGELNIDFQLFISKNEGGGKWTVEPPHWSFDINNTETGHPTLTRFADFDHAKDRPELEEQINQAAARLNDLFRIYPFTKEFLPGIHLYGKDLIVFNPHRPPYWLPVTVREVAEMKLAYYSFKDFHLLPYLKEEIGKLSVKELNAPAYSGNEELFVLNVHPGKDGSNLEEGGQIMRFNPLYWDRLLPPSSIQIMTFVLPKISQNDKEEYIKNNGFPVFGEIIMNSISLNELSAMMMKK